MKKPKLYFIPGLAATSVIFNRIDVGDYDTHYFDWKDPLPGDDIDTYAKRMLEEIDTSVPFVLVGCSLGGIMSITMSKYCKPEEIILISSLSGSEQVPWYFKMFRYLPLYWLLPYGVIKFFIRIGLKYFKKLDEKDVQLYIKMLDHHSGRFFRWAIHQVVNWEQPLVNDGVVHVHGSKDKMFPMRFMPRNMKYVIPGGSHFMVVEKGREIGGFVREILRRFSSPAQ